MGSRTAPKMKEHLTLGDIRERCTELLPDWSKRRRADLRSAIKKFAEASGKPATTIHADPEIIRILIDKASPQVAGISKSRWSNIRSLIEACLFELDVLTIRARQQCALTAAWQANMDRAEKLKTVALLSKFARWCSRDGIEPDIVNDKTFLQFEAELTDFSLAKNPVTSAAEARRAWNQAASRIDGWVGNPVLHRCRRPTTTMQWSAFPESFKNDVDAYAEARAKPSKFNESFDKPLRPATIRGHVANLRRLAGMLVREGLDASSVTCITALLTAPNVKGGLDLAWGNDEIASPMACQYAHDFVSIARFLNLEDNTLSQLIKFSRRCRRPQSGLTKQNRQRLQRFDDEDALRAMYLLPEGIAARLRGLSDIAYADAVDMRLAVCIEILLMAPLRRKNLALLDINRHIAWPISADGELQITFEEPEVKNSVQLEFLLPAESTALIRDYVERFRPVLMAQESTALFPGGVGGYMTPNSLSRIVRLGLKRELGVEFNAHLFRHFACQNHLRQNPGDYETLRRLCGHKKLETLVNFYSGTETEAAIKQFHKSVLKIREPDTTADFGDMV